MRAAADDPSQPLHARAFALWMQSELADSKVTLEVVASEAAAVTGASQQSVHVAALGYAAEVNARHRAAFATALDWLRQRKYFVQGRPLAFEIDGLALLGTAIGIRTIAAAEKEDRRIWLLGLLEKSLNVEKSKDWNHALIVAAFAITSEVFEKSSDIADDLRVALAAKTFGTVDVEDRENAWDLISSGIGFAEGMTRSAVQSTALTSLLREASTLRFGSITADDVGRLLAGVSRSMRRWSWDKEPRTATSRQAKWDISNEYHVQDLLWAVLSPVFPDLDDEEYLKSVGQLHPKADLAIPSLKLIIEVKFIRPNGKRRFVKVIEEIAADASLYLQRGSGYTAISVFVWDDSAETEHHAELRQGLLRITGVSSATILPRPKRMSWT